MTLRDRLAKTLGFNACLMRDEFKEYWWGSLIEDDREPYYKAADAVLKLLPIPLSQLEMIESGEMVVTPKVPVETRAFPAPK